VFAYAVNRRLPVDFRQFPIRHLALLRFVHTWTVRLLVPRRFRKAVSLYKAALREELWTPMNPSVAKMLETYFRERQALGGHLSDPDDRYIREEFRRQGMPKIQTLYRAWRRQGDGVLWQANSTALRDDRTHGCSGIEVEPLNRQYLQLTGTMDRDRLGQTGGQAKIASGWPPRIRHLLQTLYHPCLAMTANRMQLLDEAYVAVHQTARRRSVPPRPRAPCRCHCTNDGVNDPAAVPGT
jgi:hypothetical protein